MSFAMVVVLVAVEVVVVSVPILNNLFIDPSKGYKTL